MDDNKNPFKEQTQEQVQEEVENNQQESFDEPAAEEVVQEEVQEEPQAEQDDELNQKYEDLNNKYIRLAADFDNFRKRTLAEKEELSKFTTVEVLKKIVTVLDTFDRAQEQLKDIDNCETVKQSYEIAYKQLVDTLKKMGLSEIEALGADFNPNEHEAITQVPTDEYAPDTVAMVAQKGYKLEDRVIRPALVGVAKEKE